MSASLDSLNTRVLKLEQELSSLREVVMPESIEETPAGRGRRLLAQARREKPRQKIAAARAFGQMGIDQAPVPPEQLRQLMAACGVKAEANLFSGGIQEMRDE